MGPPEIPEEENEVSGGPPNPNRTRWATRRVTGKTAFNKRNSLLARVHKRTASGAQKATKRTSTADTAAGTDSPSFKDDETSEPGQSSETSGRRVFFNIPLPDDARDDEGHPLASFARNKIRTAKYTAISFIPKNLWFQFHNIANVYFLFIIILGVSFAAIRRSNSRQLTLCRYSKYSARRIPGSTPFP